MKNNFWLKYIFVLWIGCLVLLGTIFYMNIQHEKNIDKIFDKYDKDMKELHSTYKK